MPKLFPSNRMGLGSRGPGVLLLQLALKARGSDRGRSIELNGEYDEATRTAVRKLQKALGFFNASDLDGRFGPNTRRHFAEQFGIDVEALTTEMFQGETLCLDPD